MKGEYRNALSNKEIESILNEVENGETMIWQNINDKRIVYNISKMEYNPEKKQFIVKVKAFGDNFDLNSWVYFKVDYRSTLFKSKIEKINGSYITVGYPELEFVKTVELRSCPRTNVSLENEVLAELLIKQYASGKLSEHILKFQIFDISEKGICLLVSGENKGFMDEAAEFHIQKLGKIELKNSYILIRRHIQDFRYRKNGKNHHVKRMGFELSSSFDSQELNDFFDTI